MDKNLQDYLFSRYPKLFIEKDLSPQQTCMCWGFEHGNGWFNIVDNLVSPYNNMLRKRRKKMKNMSK